MDIGRTITLRNNTAAGYSLAVNSVSVKRDDSMDSGKSVVGRVELRNLPTFEVAHYDKVFLLVPTAAQVV